MAARLLSDNRYGLIRSGNVNLGLFLGRIGQILSAVIDERIESPTFGTAYLDKYQLEGEKSWSFFVEDFEG